MKTVASTILLVLGVELEHSVVVRSSKNACIHEDGGKYSVYELIEDESLIARDRINIGKVPVIMGPTYKVIFCACAKDTTLKEMVQWCDWCLCKHCGGKGLSRSQRNSSNFDSDSKYNSANDLTIHVFLLMLIFLILVATLVVVDDKLYMYSYVVGATSAAYVIVDILARYA